MKESAMSMLLLNIAIPPTRNDESGHHSFELTPDRFRSLATLGIAETALPFLSRHTDLSEPRLHCSHNDWTSVVSALVSRRSLEQTMDERALRERAVLILHGQQHQIERYDEGLLPLDELNTVIRDLLFAPFAGFQRRRKFKTEEIGHFQGCHQSAFAYDTTSIGTLSADPWRIYRMIEEGVEACRLIKLAETPPTGVSVLLREHRAWCAACDPQANIPTTRQGALVHVHWNGRLLSREYELALVT
jgi:hypothetical protein